jgi:transporter family protein
MALTLLSWGIWAVLSKKFSEYDISPFQGQALSTLGLAPIFIGLWLMNEPPGAGNRRRGVWLAFGSGVVSALGNVAYFAALADEKAATIVPLTALFPAVSIILAAPVLKERISLVQWVGILLSLGAIYLFSPPGEQRGLSIGIAYALLAILLWGITLLMQKLATEEISGSSSAAWFLFAFVPLAAVIALWDPLPRSLTPGLAANNALAIKLWLLATAIGFTLGLGNLTILLAFASGGKAAVIAPMSGLYPLVSIPLAILGLGESVGVREMWGIVLALAAVVLLSYPPASTSAGVSSMGD